MTKLSRQIPVLLFLLLGITAAAQENYLLQYRGAGDPPDSIPASLALQTKFDSRTACMAYVSKLPSLLRSKGYVAASVDSIQLDSLSGVVVLFTGRAWLWDVPDTRALDPVMLREIGWDERAFTGHQLDYNTVQQWQEKMLVYYEKNGHPFAKVVLDSQSLDGEKLYARWKADPGPRYKIDSIRVYGNLHVSNYFLQKYLGIPNGSLYNREKLKDVSRRITELPWAEETRGSDMSLLGTGSVLNLYLKPKRSSQINLLIGFLPNNDLLSSKKMLITGEANINLRNALGNGETIGFNWQQLQVKSPRLNILYQHPYFLHSPVGLDFSFDMYKKDSSFLNVNFQLGAMYALDAHRSGKLFIQRFQTLVDGVNTAYILQYRRLPDAADVSSLNLGLEYSFNNTDYRFNPRTGNDWSVLTTLGSRQLKKNNQIMELKDPADPAFNFGTLYDTASRKTYQFRIRFNGAHYFPAGARSTFKTMLNAGFLQSGRVYRNELFQLGGFKMLRGFDEESQFLSRYAVATAEYHYLIGRNSYFYGLTDLGWGANFSQNNRVSYTYISGGLGLAFETKAGIFNMAWAVGKRNDLNFNLRQSKIHFGFINYF